jgi:hypothetical protein
LDFCTKKDCAYTLWSKSIFIKRIRNRNWPYPNPKSNCIVTYQRGVRLRETAATFDICMVRINLVWVVGANSCKPRRGEKEQLPHEESIKTFLTGHTAVSLSSLHVYLLCGTGN